MSRGRALRAGGWAVAAAAAAIGLCAAQAVVVALALTGAVIGGMVAYLAEQSARAEGRPPRSSIDAIVRASSSGFLGVLALAGLIVVTGTAAPLIILVVLAGAAGLRHRAGRRPAAAGAVMSATGAGTLSDTDLALAWRVSHTELARARDVGSLARVSALRRDMLDEMERRDPIEFRKWLGNAAWVASDETRFLGG